MAWTTAVTRATGYGVTAAVWNSEHVDNMNFLKRVSYTEFTSDVTVTATTVGGANQIVSAGAITYENVPHLIEFECTRITAGVAQVFLIVRDSTTVLGTIGRWPASAPGGPVRVSHTLIPSAASHTYNIAAWNQSAATTVFEAGTGGTAGDATTDLPGFIRITRVPT